MAPDLHLSMLGSLEVVSESNGPIDLGGRQSRLVLAALLAASGRPVSTDLLVDALWGEAPPASASGTLQSYVSRLRARIGADAIVWDGSGYRLALAPETLVHVRFEACADEGRDLLARGDAAAARDRLVEAEALWRAPALGDLANVDALRGVAARLDDRRLAAREDRYAAELALGRHDAVAAELGELVAAHPLRERLRAAQALALYRSGRQADALRALADAARTLREELGIEPGPDLRELETAILAHDPALAAPPSSAVPDLAPDQATERALPPTTAPGATVGTVGVATPLVGRASEWDALVAAWTESGVDGRIVIVEGEPGIGKTRLAEELRLRAAAEGAVAVWGRSDEGGAAPALWPWLPPLRALAATGVEVPGPVADLLGATSSSAAGIAQAAEFELLEAVADLLVSVAATQPVVVAIDDLQWADAMSLELLGFLADRLPPRVVIVATVRRLDVGRRDVVTEALARVARRPGSRRLLLGGLAAAPTAAILDAVAGREVSPAVASAIHVRAEGNPFYAIELVRLRDEGYDLADVPASVGEVVRRRLGRLPDATVTALRAAAIIGRDVRVELVARVLGIALDDALDALDVAVEQRLLVEDPDLAGRLRFSHALVREVLVEDITALRRARLHLEVADAMEAEGAGVDEVEMVADHLWRASSVGVGRRAADALERAAAVAVQRVAYATAEDLLTKATRLRRTTGAGPDDDRAELRTIMALLEVARARRYFQAVASVEAFDRALELAERLGDGKVLVDLVWFEFSSFATASRVAEAADVAARFGALAADDPDPEVRGSLKGVLAVQAWMEGRVADGVVLCDEAIALFEEVGEITEPFSLERVMIDRCFRLFHHAVHGDWDLDHVHEEFERMAAAVPDPFVASSIHGFQGTTALVAGSAASARRVARLGLSCDPEGQFRFWHGQVQMQDAIGRAAEGDVDLDGFVRGREVYTTTGGRSALAMFDALMALEIVRHGHVDEAVALVAEGRRWHDELHEMWPLPILLWAEAVVAGANGEVDDDAEVAGIAAAADLADEQGSHRLARRIRDSVS